MKIEVLAYIYLIQDTERFYDSIQNGIVEFPTLY